MSKQQDQEQEQMIEQIRQLQSSMETEITGDEYRDCAKDRLCMLLETARCEQARMVEHEPHTNRYCAIGALLKSLGYEYKPGQNLLAIAKKISLIHTQQF
jgi:non-homologous end joining protein Ku